VTRLATAASVVLIAGTACSAAPPPAQTPPVPPRREVAEVVVPPPVASVEPEEALPTREEALGRGHELAEAWGQGPRYDEARRQAWLGEQHLDETTVRRLLGAVAKPCLSARDREAEPCKEIAEGSSEAGKITQALMEMLGAIADPAQASSPSMRILVRLDARGLWYAAGQIEELLERRLIASPGPCAPPTAADLEEARRSLSDFAIITGASGARWPSPAELDELAYFYATVASAGPEVGTAVESWASKPLPEGHPDLVARAALRDDLRDALLDGDVDRHAQKAEAYLRTLGYPGPLRLAEENDERWGGAGASYVLREWARSLEILGRYEVAEAPYRRASPGGGMCGTSTASYRDEQIEGAIRTAERRRGCRAVAAERLFAVGRIGPYGTERLAAAGFDVARLYAGALHTLGRDDAAETTRLLQALPSRATEAVARAARLGPEAWATRVRAVAGYADVAGRAGLDRLLEIAEHGSTRDRVLAIDAIGKTADDRGIDPCAPSRFFIGHPSGNDGARPVHSVMDRCDTRLSAKAIDATVRRIAALASDGDPGVRESVASTLGRLASPRGAATLEQLARDPFDAGGRVCVYESGKPEVCGPNLPVARAAKRALDELAKARAARAKQRAERARRRE
jgi:hypothetical protein